jgi:hypothetical protein
MLCVVYAECRYDECRYTECHYAECRGTITAASVPSKFTRV